MSILNWLGTYVKQLDTHPAFELSSNARGTKGKSCVINGGGYRLNNSDVFAHWSRNVSSSIGMTLRSGFHPNFLQKSQVLRVFGTIGAGAVGIGIFWDQGDLLMTKGLRVGLPG